MPTPTSHLLTADADAAPGPGHPVPPAAPHPLDNPVRAALLGAHAHLAERRGEVLRYPVDVSPFAALPERPDEQTWRDVAALFGPGAVVPVTGILGSAPAGWEVVMDLAGVQLVDAGVAAAPDDEAIPLGPADVPEMLALVERAKPGPFLPRTIALGHYLGIRRGGVLVAMAGERLHPPGWTEISAVCTAEGHRGQGLATRLVHAVAAGIRARGETPFLHAAASNTDAIRLYESLGFELRRRVGFRSVRVPATGPEARP
ncbi:GNAT family N-acetyltransferase [Kitasatospora sp. NBC_01287]|uniref:GNAT family N-acetyltransferase n=1 Tax=Kitasatospora sp. NBC_01287 TaxID=2903573 RepID=UPI00225A0736|nr:GNAT family N-acetyltransferase [Kitasatospora sp. NBC_01287]MCX4751548.1 GNAT family N-acetyltransferase [Kitasatospora sp. NBC_01287]